ncbi:VWD domain-containing protein [Spirosoma panaciterrae]|uniref:VWD domain-containing protein n=1 Tax=Spirosoma panaciterrae TaxID=496058 RepID=UPI0003701DBD|nr:VWD domain-containing protein [Spirosoma panaciterrae]
MTNLLKKLFFLFFLFITCLLSCKKDSDSSVPNTINPIGNVEQKVLYTIEVKDKTTSLGSISLDSASKKLILLYGKKKEDGSLLNVNQYASFIDQNSSIIAKFNENSFFPIEYRIKYLDEGYTLKVYKYDSNNGIIDVDITNIKTGVVNPKKSIKLDNETKTKLDGAVTLYNNNLKSARVAAGTVCQLITIAIKATEVFSCIITLPEIGATEVFVPGGVLNKLAVQTCVQASTVYYNSTVCRTYPPPNPLQALKDCFGPEIVYTAGTGCIASGIQIFFQQASNYLAQSTGDPHLTTTDSYHYDFQGLGEFTAIKSTVDNFEIQVRQEDINNTKFATMNTAIGIQTGSDVVSITSKPLAIYVNNQSQAVSTTPISLKNNATIAKTIENGVDVYSITTSNRDIIKIRLGSSNSLDYKISLSDNRKGKVIGLLGNYDGDQANDLQTREGKQISYSFTNLYPTYADSWRIDEKRDPKLLYYEPGKSTQSFTDRSFPKSPAVLTAEKLAWAKNTCLTAGVTSEPFLSNCIYDVAATNDASFTKSSLFGQQDAVTNGTTNQDDILEFKNVRITVSKITDTVTDSCLVSFSTGKVYQLKDGPKYADQIDGTFRDYCRPTLFSPSDHFVNKRSAYLNPPWNIYRKGTIETIGFPADDNSKDPNRVNSALYDFINSSNEIENAFYSHYGVFTTDSQTAITTVIWGEGCEPTQLLNTNLRRFLTQDGKKGIIRFTDWGKTANGLWITFDIKIQK